MISYLVERQIDITIDGWHFAAKEDLLRTAFKLYALKSPFFNKSCEAETFVYSLENGRKL